MSVAVVLTENFYAYRVHFNSVLHLYVRKDIVGISSWYDDHHTYSIEFTFRDGAKTTVEYHNRDLWLQVLAEFDKVLR